MMYLSRKLLNLSVTVLLLLSRAPRAQAQHVIREDAIARCSTGDSIIDPQLARGRNAWAVKCGYIRPSIEAAFNDEHMYASFTSPAPTDASTPCTPHILAGSCMLGCIASGERIATERGLIPIERVAENAFASVMTLSPHSALSDPEFTAAPLKTFVVGRETGHLLVIGVGTYRVRVTQDHPMVDGTGLVVSARDVRVGDLLLTEQGPQAVVFVSRVPYEGTVWNVLPQSMAPHANTVVVEGVVTGSQRFQSHWVARRDRIARRLLPQAMFAQMMKQGTG